MMMCESKFIDWLKIHNVSDGENPQKYVLHIPDGDLKLISHSELQALCKKYFDEMAWAAEEKFLEGESVMTQDGLFSLETVD